MEWSDVPYADLLLFRSIVIVDGYKMVDWFDARDRDDAERQYAIEAEACGLADAEYTLEEVSRTDLE